MHPVVGVLHIFGVERAIGGYGLMLSLAILVGSALVCRSAVRAGLDFGATIATVGCMLAAGLAGGWLLFVAVELAQTHSLTEALAGGGGLVFFGSIMGGAAALVVCGRLLALPILLLLDVSIAALPIAHALGRIGCFLGGCCYGRVWNGPWAVTFTDPMAPASIEMLPRHPVQLYEAAGLLLLAAVFILRPAPSPGSGRRTLQYLTSYAVLRIMTEFFRGDQVRGLMFSVSTSQWISASLLLFAAVVWRYTARKPGIVPS